MQLQRKPFGAPASRSLPRVPLFLFIAIFCIPVSYVLTQMPYVTGAAFVLGFGIFVTSVISTEAGLYILIFSMLLSPEIGVGGLGGGASAGRGLTLRGEDLLLGVFGFAWLIRMAVYKIGLIKYTPLNRPIGYYILICMFATGIGLLGDSVKGMTAFFFVVKYVEYFVLYFVVVNNIHSRSQIRRFTIALFLTAFIVSIVALAQIPSGVRVTAPFEGEQGEPNTLGGYLLFISALAAGLAFQLRDKWSTRLLVGLVVVLMIPFLFTLSRGSYAALPFVSLTFVVLNKGRRMAMLITLVGLAAVGSLAMPQRVIDRLSGTITERQSQTVAVGGVRLDPAASARVVSWQGALTDVLRSPIWGFGVTGYGFIDAQYPRILVETGFVGLAIFLWLISLNNS